MTNEQHATSEPNLPVSVQQAREALQGRIAAPPVSPLYSIGLGVVAAGMLLLPILYFAIVIGATYGMYEYSIHGWGWLAGIGSYKARGILYLAPLIGGSALVFFMAKPLIPSFDRTDRRLYLSRLKDPALFALVEEICKSVGAPMPRDIVVDSQVNASASFRGGFASLFRNDLILTIGLPLAAGLSAKELAGVLAHEFGHFAQHAGMRFSWIIRTVNSWFVRAYVDCANFGRSIGQAEGEAGCLMLFVAIFIWAARAVIWIIMTLAHAVSCFMLRQMEYDADGYEARMAGADCFGATMAKLPLLSVASAAAFHGVNAGFRAKRLPEDFPAMVMTSARKLDAETRFRVTAGSLVSKTGLLDTHPSPGDRIRRVKAENAPGIFRLDAPARALFSDFDGLCKKATHDMYSESLGEQLSAAVIVPNEKFLEDFGAAPPPLSELLRSDEDEEPAEA